MTPGATCPPTCPVAVCVLRSVAPPGERRLNRLKPPACSECGHDDSRVTVRTDYVVYFRCEHCLHVWSVPKPGHERYSTSAAHCSLPLPNPGASSSACSSGDALTMRHPILSTSSSR